MSETIVIARFDPAKTVFAYGFMTAAVGWLWIEAFTAPAGFQAFASSQDSRWLLAMVGSPLLAFFLIRFAWRLVTQRGIPVLVRNGRLEVYNWNHRLETSQITSIETRTASNRFLASSGVVIQAQDGRQRRISSLFYREGAEEIADKIRSVLEATVQT